MTKKDTENDNKHKILFAKNKILSIKKYENRVDLLNALLKDKSYTIQEVDTLIEEFMKRRLK